LLTLGGCGQPPGYQLTWRIADAHATDDMLSAAPLLERVKQCSDVGIFWVRVTTKLGDTVVETDEYPCFGIGEGPPLEPGEYTLEIEGLRRNHERWAFDPESGALRIAHAEATVTVTEDEKTPSAKVVLRAPLGCDDGIDNDLDGTVDNQDPGCEVETIDGFLESNDADLTLFQLEVSFLDNPAVKPSNVGVIGIRLEVVDEFERVLSTDLLDLEQWPFPLPLIAGEFSGGPHQLQATAFGGNGDLTTAKTVDFMALEGEGSYVMAQLDFGTDKFLEPIVQPIVLTFVPGCSVEGALVLTGMRIRVMDENDLPVPLTFIGNTFDGVEAMPFVSQVNMDGWISFECPSSWVTSDMPLMWGHYRVEAQAVLAGVTCFQSPLVDLAPQPSGAQTIALERVMVGDLPSCPECLQDSHCSGQVCSSAGLCVDKEPGQ
jgi:hypothetical protein